MADVTDGSMSAGSRVGAFAYINPESREVLLFGYGVYEGNFQFGAEAAGETVEAVKAQGNLNPRIRLDNGEVVWGAECWWMPENEAQDIMAIVTDPLSGWTVREQTPSAYRAEALGDR